MIPIELLLGFTVTGVFSGLIAGLFGVGGGLIIVPVLATVLPLIGVGSESVMQVAVGTSLAVISVTAVSSTLSHHRAGGVRWLLFAWLSPGLIAGALVGAGLAHWLSGEALRIVVGVGALLAAARMAFGRTPESARNAPPAALLLPAGALIGSLSALIGIGGGTLMVPLLAFCGVPMRQAVGTSAACGLPIAWAGTAGMILAGWDVAGLPPGNLGYVSLPGFAALALGSVACAPLGARLAQRLPQQRLRQGFALLLLLIALRMLWSGLHPA